ncbi:MAG: hypothetical protein UY96_C0017G0068 [Parcubacteria group bacterium GW2011_GWB1_56_8]|nr:MAG: hypothetical protein UY96_C0017G0068 [Parcubacteria group bacterium GW2011_GWB1_56_8]
MSKLIRVMDGAIEWIIVCMQCGEIAKGNGSTNDKTYAPSDVRRNDASRLAEVEHVYKGHEVYESVGVRKSNFREVSLESLTSDVSPEHGMA